MEAKPSTSHPFNTSYPYKVIEKFDEFLSKYMEDHGGQMDRYLICTTCAADNKEGYFPNIGKKFVIEDKIQICSEGHDIHKTLKPLVPKFGGPSALALSKFLKEGIEKMAKKPFHEFKKGELKKGDQVWIFRDKKANAVSRIMPYAHVAVFVGPNENGVNEVVHVTDNKGCWIPFRHGWFRIGIIKKVPIADVIDD